MKKYVIILFFVFALNSSFSNAENKIVYLETTTKYIDYVLKSISSRGWDIKNAIEWKKFEAGMV